MPRLDDEAVRDASASAADDNSARDGATAVPGARLGWKTLPAGEALTLSDATGITEAAPTRLVMLVGDRRVGKTTLLAELHHAFLCGPVGSQIFAGSATLPGFEERAFRARTKSRRRRPETGRTSLASGVRLLHLSVRHASFVQAAKQVLIADTSGEAFRSMRMRRQDVEALAPLMRRADNVVVLVDGARIASPRFAQKARADARTLLRAMLEGGALSGTSIVDFVLTKWDRVILGAAQSTADALFEEVQAQFAQQFGTLTCHRVAARANPKAALAPHFGVADLFSSFCDERLDRRERHRPASGVTTDSRSYLQYRDPASFGLGSQHG